MGRLILLRHGESLYNAQNLFTGWTDVDLSEKGREEAKLAGMVLAKNDLYPDVCFTSWLKRAIHTAQIALEAMVWEHIDSLRSWRLNERHYGAWQQHNKEQIKAEVGEERFNAIRRGYEISPPPLRKGDPRLLQNDPRYRKIDPLLLPRSESLKDTKRRTLHCFYEMVAPRLVSDTTVLLSAHGNSLRALTMAIENLSPEEIVGVEIPTCVPIVYSFDERLEMTDKWVVERE